MNTYNEKNTPPWLEQRMIEKRFPDDVILLRNGHDIEEILETTPRGNTFIRRMALHRYKDIFNAKNFLFQPNPKMIAEITTT